MVRDRRPQAQIELETIARRGRRRARGPGRRRLLLVRRRRLAAESVRTGFYARDALAPSTMTAIRRQTVFAGLDRPQAWPRLRGRPRPERLAASLDTLPGVGPTVKRRLAKLGLETMRDLLEAPAVPLRAVGEAIASLFGETRRSRSTATVKSVSVRKPRRRLTIVEAAVADGSGRDHGVVVQPAVGRGPARSRACACACAAACRYGFDVKSFDSASVEPRPATLAPDLSGERGDHAEEDARARDGGAAARADYWDPLPAELRATRGAAAAQRRARRAPPAADARGGGDRPPPARVRRAAAAPDRHRAPRRGTRAKHRAGARRAGRADRALPRRRCRSR